MIRRLAVTFFGLLVVLQVLPGIWSDSLLSSAIAALVLGLINLSFKPVLLLLTLPVNLLSLGLFTLVINGACLALTAWLVDGFHVKGFGSAVLGAFLLSVVTLIVNGLLKKEHA
ncbi:MAG: phage holin family protein [bacterium]|jgi:putative membrane protein|nr:phage holin family protein [bacterium]